MFGAKKRLARELAHEVLKPIGLDVDQLKDHSKVNFEASIRRVVDRGQADQLYNQQAENRRDESYDDRNKFNMKKAGR
jgi:hypothetical protein